MTFMVFNSGYSNGVWVPSKIKCIMLYLQVRIRMRPDCNGIVACTDMKDACA